MTSALLATSISVIFLLILILKVRMPAFPALLLCALLAAIGGGMSGEQALETVKNGMGGTLGFIAVVVGLGALFGALLEHSGGVQSISHTITKKLSMKHQGWAMGLVGLVVSIPVFFDVALIILFPVVKSLASKAKKPALYYGLPLLVGLATAHAFIPPTPGPIAVAELMKADLGLVIFFGFIIGLISMAIAGPFLTQVLDKKGLLGPVTIDNQTIVDQHQVDSDTKQGFKPGRTALLVICLPLLLILAGTVTKGLVTNPQTSDIIGFLSHPFVALLVGCGAAYICFKPAEEISQKNLQKALLKAFEPAGAVILVTGAGGAFKQVLVETGAGRDLASIVTDWGLGPMVVGFIIALLVRASQGSATVAMITAAGLTAPILDVGQYSDGYLALSVIAVACGATAVSHVNDSGFWLVNRYFNQSSADTLKTWTLATTILGFTGFALVLLSSAFV